jgi:hypothetical protein
MDADGAEDNHAIAAPTARGRAVVALRSLNNRIRGALLTIAVIHRAHRPYHRQSSFVFGFGTRAAHRAPLAIFMNDIISAKST